MSIFIYARAAATILLLSSLSVPASAQSFNVDFSSDGIAPPAGFAAAGSAGVWNASLISDGPLVDTSGNSTSVTMEAPHLFPVTGVDSSITGNPATLLLDGYVSDGITPLRVLGLAPGTYDLILYGLVPGCPECMTVFDVGGVGPVGGAFPGNFVLGVTHDRVQVVLGADENLSILLIGLINGQVGKPPQGFISGFQLELINPGVNYCVAAPNSVSTSGARISASGSSSVLANDLGLTAGPVPAGSLGIFFYGPNSLSGIPFSNGFRCVGGPPGTVVRMPSAVADANGSLTVSIDNTGPAHGQILAGQQTLNFQCWYLDSSPVPGPNFSDAVTVVFY